MKACRHARPGDQAAWRAMYAAERASICVSCPEVKSPAPRGVCRTCCRHGRGGNSSLHLPFQKLARRCDRSNIKSSEGSRSNWSSINWTFTVVGCGCSVVMQRTRSQSNNPMARVDQRRRCGDMRFMQCVQFMRSFSAAGPKLLSAKCASR
ncbi:hypothetical protein BO71DRAFT_163106 [Aspergillus ellipticus CBS 707.79]|uniref:Uncharacterized protein n=1 Tax=Aspergillus ellipticus CBS 707.79 TaxID=1448320 RepID=A0A319CR92_9EURO|nr:hypothetical protein BO71DRAFT_163106 [Aspergillus ellipticus CBS 707.79]